MDRTRSRAWSSPRSSNPRVTEDGQPLLHAGRPRQGDDAKDVAAYVAEYAGVPGVEPPIPPDARPGAQVFLPQGCGSCHTLAALGDVATGTVGPNLDEVLPGQSEAGIEESIVDPNADDRAGIRLGRDARHVRRHCRRRSSRTWWTSCPSRRQEAAGAVAPHRVPEKRRGRAARYPGRDAPSRTAGKLARPGASDGAGRGPEGNRGPPLSLWLAVEQGRRRPGATLDRLEPIAQELTAR